MSKTYYKIVAVKDGKLLSRAAYSGNLRNNDLVVEYKENEWVHQPKHGGKLMVFESKALAEDHIFFWDYNPETCDYEYRIHACKVKNPSNKGVFFEIDTRYEEFKDWLNRMIDLRIKKKKYLEVCVNGSIPEGTIFCDSVMLLERVK